jgi:hypothetical protein
MKYLGLKLKVKIVKHFGVFSHYDPESQTVFLARGDPHGSRSPT